MATDTTAAATGITDAGTLATPPLNAGVPTFSALVKGCTPATHGTPALIQMDHSGLASQAADESASKLSLVMAWLVRIGEDDKDEVERVLQACMSSADVMQFHLHQAVQMISTAPGSWDERRKCTDCANLEDGYCMAAYRGEINAARTYSPVKHIPQRCRSFAPIAEA